MTTTVTVTADDETMCVVLLLFDCMTARRKYTKIPCRPVVIPLRVENKNLNTTLNSEPYFT